MNAQELTTRVIPDLMQVIEKADVLVNALPYMQAYRNKTVLIKFGGSAMDDPALVKDLMRDIAVLEAMGLNPVVVHGGGKAISKAMAESGLEAKFVNGLRVTTKEAIGIVERTLSGTINPGLVEMLRDAGGKGVGIPGTEVFVGEKIREKDAEGNPVDIGEVGRVIGTLLPRIEEALNLEITPVISPLAKELGTHSPLNINADLAAAALARELRPVKLIYISDVPGILRDAADPTSLIQSINRKQALQLIEDGVVSGGMIPKVKSAVDALNAGVRKVHFIDGRLPHTLLLEIFTTEGIGTEIVREQR
ncbi:acetylglutamate kinase [Akkermansia glycaniphila]|uniref:Acetylglutamate kinase n=1 Tax=Akkermansia glycaniphila TaxID=1679444 RepID=A0A1C7PCH6_9BACT|nr:acetylglutamate kinase [Akkermansia glycaniphila]OCA03283.1 acetylglutamate kinase [Akkermansia glycaniphila]SEH81304.1 aspartate/glutamate/uridylate kinase [Akkermansia glycaniphila]